MADTLGVVESRSIAAGVLLADGMLKAARVELLRAATICSGRYIVYVAGDREAVETAVRFAGNSGRALAGSFVLSRVSPQVLDALKPGAPREAGEQGDALGVVECRTASSGIAAADAAVKRAAVRLLRLVAGQGITGKAYFVLGGDTASVTEAVDAAAGALGKNLVEAVVLPRPDGQLAEALAGIRNTRDQ